LCILLISLASKTKVKIQEVAIRPRVRRFTRFVSRISVLENDTSICWVFRATLSDGSAFAIDVCNAQYGVSSPEDADRGVFPWGQYMERLSVSHGDLIKEQALEVCFQAQTKAGLTGNVADVQAGVLTAEDKQAVARFFVSTVALVTALALPYSHGGLTLSKLVRLPSSGFDKAVTNFKTGHQKSLNGMRKMIDDGAAQRILLERFAGGQWLGPGRGGLEVSFPWCLAAKQHMDSMRAP
jgi:hypothetical protein